MKRSDRDAAIVFAVALLARLGVVARAAHAPFPPTADGVFYFRFADRIAHGLGVTVVWPDGVVTYASHYPVGYSAILGGVFALLGTSLALAMIVNALFGAAAALAAHRLADRATTPRRALIAGLAVALHPGLVLYTPAMMTEGVTASLLVLAAWAAARAREDQARFVRHAITIGAVLGVATLVRPQSIVFAPIFAALAFGVTELPRSKALARAAAAASIALATTLAACAPWTARNCVHMHRCALVSVNGGWNLLIGADPDSTGSWSEIKTPEECKTVFDEAEKDVCFERAGRRYIAEHPAVWLALAPKKLAATFDYAGAAGWYLHASNPRAFPDKAKIALGGVETVMTRLLVGLALCGAAFKRGPRRTARMILAAIGVISLFVLQAWIGWLALPIALFLLGRGFLKLPILASATAIAVFATALTHAVFFGAGRYSLVLFPLIAALGASSARKEGPNFDRQDGVS